MNLTTQHEGSTLVVSVDEPRIDAAVAIRFKDRFREVTTGWRGRILLDLGRVAFIDSSGLGAIVAVLKQLEEGQTMELASLQPNVDRVFRLTRMDTVFAIHDTIPDAVRDHAD